MEQWRGWGRSLQMATRRQCSSIWASATAPQKREADALFCFCSLHVECMWCYASHHKLRGSMRGRWKNSHLPADRRMLISLMNGAFDREWVVAAVESHVSQSTVRLIPMLIIRFLSIWLVVAGKNGDRHVPNPRRMYSPLVFTFSKGLHTEKLKDVR